MAWLGGANPRIIIRGDMLLVSCLLLACGILASTTPGGFISAALAGTTGGGDETLFAAFVLHRHGARYPMPSVNASAICGARCGQLDDEGAKMLNALGREVRARFNNTNRSLMSSVYDPRVVTSTSTAVDRTIQSAQWFVRGLFGDWFGANRTGESKEAARIAPVVETRSLERDRQLLVWTGWPSIVAWSNATFVEFNSTMTQTTLRIFDGRLAELTSVGQLMGLGDECPSQIFQCALDLQDLWESLSARGEVPPPLEAISDLLNENLIAYNRYSWYNASSSPAYFRAVGGKGYFLVQDMLQRVEAASVQLFASAPTIPNLVFHEYSGHDTTLMPFAESIGNDTLVRPRYAGAFLVEAWVNNAALLSAAPPPLDAVTIRLYYGEPQKRRGSAPPVDGSQWYDYSFEPSPMRCIGESSTSSSSSSSADGGSDQGLSTRVVQGCSLPAWRRFLATRAPRVPEKDRSQSFCFAPEWLLQGINCTADQPPGVPESSCATFRAMCPFTACGGDVGVNATLHCPTVAVISSDGTALWHGLDGVSLLLLTMATTSIALVAIMLGLVRLRERCCPASAQSTERLPHLLDGAGGSGKPSYEIGDPHYGSSEVYQGGGMIGSQATLDTRPSGVVGYRGSSVVGAMYTDRGSSLS